MTDPIVARLRAELRHAAEPGRAAGMRAYMRSAMPFLGVRRPVVRRIVRTGAGTEPADGLADLLRVATVLWREATYREERYAATDLLGLRVARGRPEVVPLCTEMIVTGAWWDHVDAVAPLLGAVLRAHRAEVEPMVRGWSVDPNFWLRRAAIICQLDAKVSTDPVLLADVIEENLTEREFFVRKAIGWALRQYARTDPDWVREFVAAHRDNLSPLSYREAVKHLT
ncbi:MAG TPA: DNA alkylation repair protein [Nakamurella sp.]